MAKFCGNCGTPLVPTAIFCGGCGTKVPAAPSAPAGMPAPYAPVQPVPAAAAYSPAQPTFTPVPAAQVASPSGYSPVAPTIDAAPVATSPGYSPVAPTYEPPPVQPANAWADTPAPFATSPGYSPVAPTYEPPPVQPANAWADTPAPFATSPGYSPIAPTYEPSLVQPAKAWADTPAPVANSPRYSPLAPTYEPPPVQPARAWDDTPAPSVPVAEPAEFAPIASAFDIAPVTPVAEAWADSTVPAASIPPSYTPAAVPQDFNPVAPVNSPLPVRPAVESGGFTAANASFTAVGAAPANAQAAYVPAYPPTTPPVAPSLNVAPSLPAAGGYEPVSTGAAPQQLAYSSPQGTFTGPAAAGVMAGTAYAPVKKSNTLLKVIVALILIIFVGSALALAGLWYAAQKIKAKAHSVTSQVLSGHPPSTAGGLGALISGATSGADTGDSASENAGGFKGEPCRFLSKEEVSQAAHLSVIRTEASAGDCNYIAKGDPADVTSKHMSSMVGGMGADAKSQKMAQKFGGAYFAQQEAGDKDLKAQAANGEVTVLVLSFTAGHAAMEMKLNRGAFHRIGAGSGRTTAANSGSGDLPDVGDEAFVVGGSSIMVRKGNTMTRMM